MAAVLNDASILSAHSEAPGAHLRSGNNKLLRLRRLGRRMLEARGQSGQGMKRGHWPQCGRTSTRLLTGFTGQFHRVDASSLLTPSDRMRLDAITEMVDCIWLSGNHDPAPHAIGGTCLPQLELAGLTLSHEPQRGANGLVAGHLHPAAHVYFQGRSTRRPCFVHDNRLLILPAYGASTGSINILSPAFASLFHWPALEVTMLGRDRTYPVSPKRLVQG